MATFSVKSDQLDPVKETGFKLEREIQSLTEKNLDTLFGYKFIASEFQLNNLRIDTLAYNPDLKSFVVIEYKRDKSISVVDQGYAYLALMLNNQAEFILEYNETQKDNLKRKDIDWTQSKVLFLANSFTVHQREAINFRDIPIELWEVRLYANQTITYDQIKPNAQSESIKTVSKDSLIKKVSSEVKSYSIEDLFPTAKKDQRDLFDEIDEMIKALDPQINANPRKYYIGYTLGSDWRNFIYAGPLRNGIRIELARTKPEDLRDPEKKLKYKTNSLKNFGQHVSILDIGQEDVEYSMSIIRQVYKKHVHEFGK